MVTKRPIVYDGDRYYLGAGGKSKPDNWKGFGGRKFTIWFSDDEMVQTDDLILDYSRAKHDEPDTCIIYQGWGKPGEIKMCEWKQVGPYRMFAPIA